MTTKIPSIAKQPLVDALDQQWLSLAELMAGLPEDAWNTPTTLPGWTVHDVFAHIVGTESSLLGEQPVESASDFSALAHVHNPIAVFNEQWVDMLRGHSPEQLLARFNEVTGRRRKAIAAMSQADFDAPSWTPLGQGTYARFMQIRVFDCWMHEQDIRDAVGRPGHDDGPRAELVIDEIQRGLGYIVGKLGRAPQGSSVTFSLTGPVRRAMHVRVDDRAKVVDSLAEPATTTITLPSTLFAQLAGGRTRADDNRAEIGISGDTGLGEQIVRNLAYTI
ncbi:TIGR03083 family protein [Amycolatopsis marina]|uniref:TIGR03083 family protein n=1 Tax=Amycolatopsis marina TaxID=490629 RepID=A0A1I1AIQ1_9PSEU|nr:maleylpyruvate isomerase family mycothiol-dependent enzyme [Amycolatopsis marina]SFB37895.1 TIGR03083 family protein [Amycolatopsis marina]